MNKHALHYAAKSRRISIARRLSRYARWVVQRAKRPKHRPPVSRRYICNSRPALSSSPVRLSQEGVELLMSFVAVRQNFRLTHGGVFPVSERLRPCAFRVAAHSSRYMSSSSSSSSSLNLQPVAMTERDKSRYTEGA
ncbi:hypothetical protein EVAR_28740_1 [Eumeta japonica]|uniref:Uncharacterized protein n=1 Tax=Eumeta variegata TaxID=151549 RepID=A0A4C1YYU1_EUMVA|nr:hypothetical protein EVAR_28740_1 [Eumeta japonica]